MAAKTDAWGLVSLGIGWLVPFSSGLFRLFVHRWWGGGKDYLLDHYLSLAGLVDGDGGALGC
jgi:hypothetical protein